MLDNDSVMAKTVNGFKTKLEWERAKKMGLFLDWCLLDLEAVTEFRSSHPASILQVSIVVMLNELQIFEASVFNSEFYWNSPTRDPIADLTVDRTLSTDPLIAVELGTGRFPDKTRVTTQLEVVIKPETTFGETSSNRWSWRHCQAR